MKYLALVVLLVMLGSCKVRLPYTDKIAEEYGLDESRMKGVQFYTSQTIKMVRKDDETTSTTTDSNGDLVKASSSETEFIVIPPNTKCIFEEITEDEAVLIRFEIGTGKFLTFHERQNMTSGRYYLVAAWKNGKGIVEYGNEEYTVEQGASQAYLMVKVKKSMNTKRKGRVVKGMKV